MSLPSYTSEGYLPPGDYALTLEQLRHSTLVRCPDVIRYPAWDHDWRLQLVDNLEIICRQLWKIGITEIYIDGSFTEDKDHPNDIDGYFVCDLHYFASGDLEQDLNLLDEFKIWTWAPESRRAYTGYPKKQLPMWHQYRVELYPHFGQLSGITDEFGNDLEFPAAFRKTRNTNQEKGIIRILKGDTL